MDRSADRFLLEGWEVRRREGGAAAAVDSRTSRRARSAARAARRTGRWIVITARARLEEPAVNASMGVEVNGQEIGRFVVPPTAPLEMTLSRSRQPVGRIWRAGYNRLTFVSYGVQRVDPSDTRPPGPSAAARGPRVAGGDLSHAHRARVMSDRPLVSVVVPVFNGAELVPPCQAALSPVLERMPAAPRSIYVDDGSTDGTIEALRSAQVRDPRVRIVELAANFGQHAAFTAGFEHARGRYLVTLDVDLQCDPADIPRLIEPLTRGYDLVSGVRLNRQDPAARQLFSRADDGAGHPAGGRAAARHRLPAQRVHRRRGAEPGGVRRAAAISEAARRAGRAPRHRSRGAASAASGQRAASSYSATGLVRLFMDFFVNALGDVFAWVFLVAAGASALLVARQLGAAVAAAAGGRRRGASSRCWRALAMQPLLVALFGLAGDYVQRIYRQSSGRPFFLVRRVHEAARPAGRLGDVRSATLKVRRSTPASCRSSSRSIARIPSSPIATTACCRARRRTRSCSRNCRTR